MEKFGLYANLCFWPQIGLQNFLETITAEARDAMHVMLSLSWSYLKILHPSRGRPRKSIRAYPPAGETPSFLSDVRWSLCIQLKIVEEVLSLSFLFIGLLQINLIATRKRKISVDRCELKWQATNYKCSGQELKNDIWQPSSLGLSFLWRSGTARLKDEDLQFLNGISSFPWESCIFHLWLYLHGTLLWGK